MPLKRSRLNRGKKTLARKKLQQKNAKLERCTELRAETRIKPFNAERKKKLFDKQFGEKSKDMRGMPCCVTGHRDRSVYQGQSVFKVEHAHVGSPDPDVRQRTRAAGANSDFLAPLRTDVHYAFDNATDLAFERKYGKTKQWVRQWAADFDVRWKASRA